MMPYRIRHASGKVDPGFRRDDDLWEALRWRLPPPQPSPASGGGSLRRNRRRVGAQRAIGSPRALRDEVENVRHRSSPHPNPPPLAGEGVRREAADGWGQATEKTDVGIGMERIEI